MFGGKPKVTEAQWAEIIEEYRNCPDLTVSECGRRLGIAMQSVKEQFVKRGVTIRRYQSPVRLSAVDLYVNHPEVTLEEIGAALGITGSTVSRHTRRAGSPMLRSPYIPDEVKDFIAQLYEERTLSVREICALVGVARDSVEKVVRERKLKRRGPRGRKVDATLADAIAGRFRKEPTLAAAKIARELALNPKTIINSLRASGFVRRDGKWYPTSL